MAINEDMFAGLEPDFTGLEPDSNKKTEDMFSGLEPDFNGLEPDTTTTVEPDTAYMNSRPQITPDDATQLKPIPPEVDQFRKSTERRDAAVERTGYPYSLAVKPEAKIELLRNSISNLEKSKKQYGKNPTQEQFDDLNKQIAAINETLKEVKQTAAQKELISSTTGITDVTSGDGYSKMRSAEQQTIADIENAVNAENKRIEDMKKRMSSTTYLQRQKENLKGGLKLAKAQMEMFSAVVEQAMADFSDTELAKLLKSPAENEQLKKEHQATAERLAQEYVKTTEEAERDFPETIPSYKEGFDSGKQFLEYVSQAATRNAGNTAISLLTGGITSLGGRALIAKTGKKLAADAAAKGLSKEVTDKLLKTAANKIVAKAAILGVLPSSVALETGSIAGESYKETGKINVGTSALAGLLAGSAEAVTPVLALTKIFGSEVADQVRKTVFERYGKEMLKQFTSEALTEVPQSLIEEAAQAHIAGRPLPQDIADRLAEAFFQGGFGGLGTGLATQATSDAAEGAIKVVKSALTKEIEAQQPNTDPSPDQAEAGNQKKAHVKVGGMDLAIENPAGSIRKSKDPENPWQTEMKDHYGYIKGVEGKDKDKLDIFINPDENITDKVFVIDQVNPETGAFDEHKVLYGYSDIETAKAAYLRNYEEGWQGLGAITELPEPAFKAWIKEGKLTEPLSKLEPKEGDTQELIKDPDVLTNEPLQQPAKTAEAKEEPQIAETPAVISEKDVGDMISDEELTKIFEGLEPTADVSGVQTVTDPTTQSDPAIQKAIDLAITDKRKEARTTFEELSAAAEKKLLEDQPGIQITPDVKAAIAATAELTARNPLSKLSSKIAKNSAIKAMEKPEENSSVVSTQMDLDFFKRFNDTFGHETGDKFLSEVLPVVSSIAKNLDMTYYHESGDEHSILDRVKNEDLPSYYKRLKKFKERISELKVILPNGITVPISSTMGTAVDKDIHKALSRAEKTMGQQKKTGKNYLTIDKLSKIDYNLWKDVPGQDLGVQYEEAGLLPTGREREAENGKAKGKEVPGDVRVQGQEGNKRNGIDEGRSGEGQRRTGLKQTKATEITDKLQGTEAEANYKDLTAEQAKGIIPTLESELEASGVKREEIDAIKESTLYPVKGKEDKHTVFRLAEALAEKTGKTTIQDLITDRVQANEEATLKPWKMPFKKYQETEEAFNRNPLMFAPFGKSERQKNIATEWAAEYSALVPKMTALEIKAAKQKYGNRFTHRTMIENALKAKKDVPLSVLKEYQDLYEASPEGKKEIQREAAEKKKKEKAARTKTILDMPIEIQREAGNPRIERDRSAREHTVTNHDNYGTILETETEGREPLTAWINPKPEADSKIFVINEHDVKEEGKPFKGHVVVLGYAKAEDAVNAHSLNHPKRLQTAMKTPAFQFPDKTSFINWATYGRRDLPLELKKYDPIKNPAYVPPPPPPSQLISYEQLQKFGYRVKTEPERIKIKTETEAQALYERKKNVMNWRNYHNKKDLEALRQAKNDALVILMRISDPEVKREQTLMNNVIALNYGTAINETIKNLHPEIFEKLLEEWKPIIQEYNTLDATLSFLRKTSPAALAPYFEKETYLSKDGTLKKFFGMKAKDTIVEFGEHKGEILEESTNTYRRHPEVQENVRQIIKEEMLIGQGSIATEEQFETAKSLEDRNESTVSNEMVENTIRSAMDFFNTKAYETKPNFGNFIAEKLKDEYAKYSPEAIAKEAAHWEAVEAEENALKEAAEKELADTFVEEDILPGETVTSENISDAIEEAKDLTPDEIDALESQPENVDIPPPPEKIDESEEGLDGEDYFFSLRHRIIQSKQPLTATKVLKVLDAEVMNMLKAFKLDNAIDLVISEKPIGRNIVDPRTIEAIISPTSPGRATLWINPRLTLDRLIDVLVHEIVGHLGIQTLISQDATISKQINKLFLDEWQYVYNNRNKYLSEKAANTPAGRAYHKAAEFFRIYSKDAEYRSNTLGPVAAERFLKSEWVISKLKEGWQQFKAKSQQPDATAKKIKNYFVALLNKILREVKKFFSGTTDAAVMERQEVVEKIIVNLLEKLKTRGVDFGNMEIQSQAKYSPAMSRAAEQIDIFATPKAPAAAATSRLEPQADYVAVYNDKTVPMGYAGDLKQQFQRASMRVVDNAPEGIIVSPKGAYFHVSRSFRMAKPVTREQAQAIIGEEKAAPQTAQKPLEQVDMFGGETETQREIEKFKREKAEAEAATRKGTEDLPMFNNNEAVRAADAQQSFFSRSPKSKFQPVNTESENFKNWFRGSKVVDEKNNPLVVYSGHSNVEIYGTKFSPKKATAGGFYSSEDPNIASSYSLSKLGSKEYYENGDQYRLAGKNGKMNKKLWQYELSEEQKKKFDELATLQNEYGDEIYRGMRDMRAWAKDNKDYDKTARRLYFQPYNLQAIWEYFEHQGYNITYVDNEKPGAERKSYFEMQNKNATEELLDALGIQWTSADWAQPGVMPLYLSIKNPIDAEKPFPSDLLEALERASKREKEISSPEQYAAKWTRDYPLKQWVKDIKAGNEYWTTHIPSKALPIIKQFGYDGIKELGNKGAKTREERQTNWIAFESNQIKSAVTNTGEFSQDADMRYSLSADMPSREILEAPKYLKESDIFPSLWEKAAPTRLTEPRALEEIWADIERVKKRLSEPIGGIMVDGKHTSISTRMHYISELAALRQEMQQAYEELKPLAKQEAKNLYRNMYDNRLSRSDESYLKAVESGDMETAQKMVDKAAKKAGYTTKAYHGTDANFNMFDTKKMNSHGSSEGYGFYFTDDENTAKGYRKENSGRVISAYLDLQNPIANNAPRFNIKQLTKVIDDIIEKEISQSGGDVNNYRDTFISNYTNTYSTPRNRAVREVADTVFEGNDNAIDQIAELANATGNKSLVLTSIRDVLGFDSIKSNGYGNFGEAGGTIYVAWFPNQIKSADPVTYDDNGKVIPLSQRFTDSNDIRYSLSDAPIDESQAFLTDKEIDAVDVVIAKPEAQGQAPEAIHPNDRLFLKNLELQKKKKNPDDIRAAEKKAAEGTAISKALTPISDQLFEVAPELRISIRRYIRDFLKFRGEMRNAVQPYMVKKKAMTDLDKSAYDLAEKNGWESEITRLNNKYNMAKEYAAKRAALDRIYTEAKRAGFELGWQDIYAPRSTSDIKGFMEYIYGDRPDLARAMQDKKKTMDLKVEERIRELTVEYEKKISDFTNKQTTKIEELRAELFASLQSDPEAQQGIAGLDTGTKTEIEKRNEAIRQQISKLEEEGYNKVQELRLESEERLQEQESKKRPLTQEEIWKLANSLIRGYRNDNLLIPKPGFLEKRAIEFISPEMNVFYDDSDLALIKYIDNMTQSIEMRKYFGQYAVLKDEQLDVPQSIGRIVASLMREGRMNPDKEARVIFLLNAYFSPKAMSSFVNTYRTIEYIETLGHVHSAISQLQDQAFSIAFSGAFNWLKAIANKNKIDVLKDFHLENIVADLIDTSKSSQMLNNVLKLTGLSRLDRFGKDMLVNGAYYKYKAMANNPKDREVLLYELKDYVGEDKAEQTLEEFKRGELTDNTMLALFNTIMDFNPIDPIELPPYYSLGGNLRALYMLKTYTVKQLSIYAKYLKKSLKHPNKEIRKRSFKLLVQFVGAIIALGMGTDVLKALISGRQIYISDLVMDNILRIFGVSKYQIYQWKPQGDKIDVVTSGAKMVAPPFRLFESTITDISRGVGAVKEGGRYYVKDMELWQSVPLAGKLFYWNLGGGLKKTQTKAIYLELKDKKDKGSIAWKVANERLNAKQQMIYDMYMDKKSGIVSDLLADKREIEKMIIEEPAFSMVMQKRIDDIDKKIREQKYKMIVKIQEADKSWNAVQTR